MTACIIGILIDISLSERNRENQLLSLLSFYPILLPFQYNINNKINYKIKQ